MPKTRRVLSSMKCQQCRMDKQKCLPIGRTWPGTRCDRCKKFDYVCSANRLRREERAMSSEDSRSVTAADDASDFNSALTVPEKPKDPFIEKYVGPGRQIYRQLANIDLILDTIANSKTASTPPIWNEIFTWPDLENWLQSERQLCKQRAASEAQKALEIPDRATYQEIISNTFYDGPKVPFSEVKPHFATFYIQLNELNRNSENGRNQTTAVYLGEQIGNTLATIDLDWKAQIAPLIDVYTKSVAEISMMGQHMAQIASFMVLWRSLDIYNSHLHSSVYKARIPSLLSNRRAQEAILFRAAQKGSLIMVKHFLEDGGFPVESKDSSGRTLLHFACWQTDTVLLDYLISMQADLFAKDMHNDNVFHHAARHGRNACLDPLLRTAAKKLVLEPNKNGALPFDVALLNKKRPCYQTLAKGGAKDRFGNPKEGVELTDVVHLAKDGEPDFLLLPGVMEPGSADEAALVPSVA